MTEVNERRSLLQISFDYRNWSWLLDLIRPLVSLAISETQKGAVIEKGDARVSVTLSLRESFRAGPQIEAWGVWKAPSSGWLASKEGCSEAFRSSDVEEEEEPERMLVHHKRKISDQAWQECFFGIYS